LIRKRVGGRGWRRGREGNVPFAVDLDLHEEEAFLVAEGFAEAFGARAAGAQVLDLLCEAIDFFDVALGEGLGLLVEVDGVLVRFVLD
jgi:hypothetical protein